MSNNEVAWIEAAWQSHGYECRIVANNRGWRCGYVGVPEGHPWAESEPDVHVHGGITYTGSLEITRTPSLVWVGFDCNHLGDVPDPTIQSPEEKKIYNNNEGLWRSGVLWTSTMVRDEVERLVEFVEKENHE